MKAGNLCSRLNANGSKIIDLTIYQDKKRHKDTQRIHMRSKKAKKTRRKTKKQTDSAREEKKIRTQLDNTL